jgi:hypothetical protein
LITLIVDARRPPLGRSAQRLYRIDS